jgi:SAM-dependent methyltransferase
MDAAPDGSPVGVYALLPARGEGAIIARAVPPGASIVELGCGTGRMTRQLVELGFRVTAVDESAAMLAHVHDAEVVEAKIEALDLGRRFDAVLLASNLITTSPAQRRAFLETCLRHSDVTVVEMLPLAWQPEEGESTTGGVVSRLRVTSVLDGVVTGTVEYEARGQTWEHSFDMRVFADEDELGEALAEGGLRLDRWLDRDRGWFVARAVPARA